MNRRHAIMAGGIRRHPAATYEGLTREIEAVIPRRTWDNLVAAKRLGITPTQHAYRTCTDTLYQR